MRTLILLFFALCSILSLSVAQTVFSTPTATATSSSGTIVGTGTSSNATASSGGGGTGTTSASSSTTSPPDVLLRVPNLSVGRIELDVDNLSAEINLAAEVASLVTINAGIQVGVTRVNITIVDVEAELELIVRLGNLVSIVNRTLATLDLTPDLINILNDVTDVVTEVVGAVDGLLGSITQGGTTLNYIIDNLGNIVQEVAGDAGNTVSTIVGNYLQNMTFTGEAETLSGGLVEKTYEYTQLGALVNIIFNALGQVVQATVVGSATGTSTTVPTSTSGASTATGAAARF